MKIKQTAAPTEWNPTNPAFDPNEPMQVSGQAVIEGVMMRAKGMIATAVRRPNGSIVVKKEQFHSFVERYPRFNIAIVRGAVGLIEMMYIGIKTLNYSAEIALEDPSHPAESPYSSGVPKERASALSLTATLVLAFGVGIGLFFFLPLFVATMMFKIEQQPFLFNLVAGAIRITILLAYLYSISLMADVRRLFQYHGAEHKAVYTFERNAPLQISSAMTFTRFHPRCGTSFILLVMFVSILLFSLLDTALMLVAGSLTLTLRLTTHIPFVPVIGGLSYEVLKLSARHATSPVGRVIAAPGLWLQKITTKEPDEAQMEVSLAAIKAALCLDAEPAAAESPAAVAR